MSEPIAGLRRLPWTTDSGNPAYLANDDPNSPLSLMADSVEAQLIDSARQVLSVARKLRCAELGAEEVRHTVSRLTECLSDAINVATMRGERLGVGDG